MGTAEETELAWNVAQAAIYVEDAAWMGAHGTRPTLTELSRWVLDGIASRGVTRFAMQELD